MSRIAEGVSQMTEGVSPRRKAQSFQAPLYMNIGLLQKRNRPKH
jgi:hypothetical protein